jgi:hypothetical protein
VGLKAPPPPPGKETILQRKTTWLAAATVGSAVAAATLLGPAAAASAAPAPPAVTPGVCDTQIIAHDTPGISLGPGTSVTQAMNKLEAKGVDVRIRLFQVAPPGGLDAYEQAMTAGCPSWSLNGQIKPNLLVILVSLDHQDAIFYGSNLSRLQGQVDQIRADMGTDFRAGNIAAGIAQGENEAYGTLYPSGLPDWEIALIALAVLIVVAGVAAAAGGSGRGYGGGYRSNTVIVGGGGFGGGFGGGSGGGGAGGSSGSW